MYVNKADVHVAGVGLVNKIPMAFDIYFQNEVVVLVLFSDVIDLIID